MAKQRFRAYVGFSEGKPHTEHVLDEYGDCIALNVFHGKADALKRYEDVREVEIVIVRRARKGKGDSRE